ncbi:MAG TPA: superoxide dismutase family protein [Nitrobacter sp.]|jgi:Cu-Zn family superoxide dismutase|nr:superoxide dismutase family protein [Nitrobacter sp.]
MMVRALLLSAMLAAASGASAAETAKAVLKNANGADVGVVELTQVDDGVLLRVALKGLPPGDHAFHVHAVGKCEPPFDSAGGHFNPGNRKHGMMATDGHHAGDMPNLEVPASGEVKLEMVNTAITLEKGKPNSVLKPGGAALVVHAAPDDYKTDPAGNAGSRIACGVIE